MMFSSIKRVRTCPAVRHAFRYALPFYAVLAALLAQGALQRILPPAIDFPYAFFYLIAAFVSAWFGGYVPGALACLLTIVGLPLAVTGFSHMPAIDISRLALFIAVSLFISKVAATERRAQAMLRRTNHELDRRVQARTSELNVAVEQLESEIGGHRETETALRESEERVAFALEGVGLGRWDVDLATGRTNRSLRHDQIFGYDTLLPEWTSEIFTDHVLPQDRVQVQERFVSAVRDGSVCEFECRIKRLDEAIRWIGVRGKIRRDASGYAVSIHGIIGDITDRKLAEEKLRTQIERLSLLDQISRAIGERQDLRSIFQVVARSLEDNLEVDFAGVCLYDPLLDVFTVACVGRRNEALATELAMTGEARIGIGQNDLARCLRGELVYEPDTSQLHLPFSRRLAKSGLGAVVAAPLRSDDGVLGVLLACRREPNSFTSADCEFLRQLSQHVALASQQAEIYGALQRAYDDLRQSQQAVQEQERLRALGQMASGFAHDINNALSPVALYTESLLANEPNLSARARGYLETIERSVDDVAHTVGRMREFYRRREPQLVLRPVDINQLVEEVLDLSRARWFDMPQQRGIVIQVRTELAPDAPPLAGIESEVREALLNLIFNAVDAMPDGGTLTLRTEAAHDATEVGTPQSVRVEVKDTGVGMDEETRRRCLEPFFTTKGERGTGLGLAMVYGTAQRLNAQLEIESASGTGTVVRLTFAGSTAEPAPQSYVTSAPLRLSILVVDDDPLISKSIRDALEGDGHTVAVAHGGREGIDLWRAALERQKPFAVVITDLGMPHVDGRKVATAIKTGHPETPVILLTGWGQRMEAEQDVPAHVDRVLNKPPKLQELRAALRELVTSVSPQHAGAASGA